MFEELKDHRGNPAAGASAMSDSLVSVYGAGYSRRYFKPVKRLVSKMLTLLNLKKSKTMSLFLAVVLQIILMQITMQFLCGDRSRFYAGSDEAWLIFAAVSGAVC